MMQVAVMDDISEPESHKIQGCSRDFSHKSTTPTKKMI